MNKTQNNQKNFNDDENREEADYLGDYVSGEEYRQQMSELSPQVSQKISWQQKFAAVFLVIFGLSAFVLWIVQFRSGLTIGEPLTEEELAELRQNRGSGEADVEALQMQDTDNDGLSDYDELYFYETSPYLEDTDSDGISDKVEIERGDDPACPAGQECFNQEQIQSDISGTDQNQQSEQNEPEFDMEAFNEYMQQSGGQDSLNVFEEDMERQLIQDILSGEAEAESLRQLLLKSGMDPNMLNQIDNDQLINTYKNTLQNN